MYLRYHSGHQSRLGGYNTASSSGSSSLSSGPWASGYGPAPHYLQHREYRQQQRHPYMHQQQHQSRNGNNYQSSQSNYHGYQQRNGNSDRYGGNSGGNSGWRR
ncbi:PREDICTED: uncharacterized protein LOC107064047 isoform X3 [Polistes dominula]|uniref:Uncharacterized protein LOC107064047 isoform X3 n=1 Tax=Polistes dominula TaxID=743375 RepID=A0ABM1HUZ9_POLDO|nr:PREDICTED: uncharacterized protein LOC107064047 isoform X3 [Polistes dominula]